MKKIKAKQETASSVQSLDVELCEIIIIINILSSMSPLIYFIELSLLLFIDEKCYLFKKDLFFFFDEGVAFTTYVERRGKGEGGAIQS